MNNPTTPCNSCPWRRDVTPGALGGSPATTFIGQAFGPFMLPCHCKCDFGDPAWKSKVTTTPQCAGAAIFRANVGVANWLPRQLHALPANTDLVFGSAAEFLAHHYGTSVADAEFGLSVMPVPSLVKAQLQRSTNTFHPASTIASIQ